MKNFKQIAFGLLVGALAIGFSAFTNAKKAQGNFYVLESVDGQYHRITSGYDAGNCTSIGSNVCSYQQTAGSEDPATLSPSSIAANSDFTAQGTTGVYNP